MIYTEYIMLNKRFRVIHSCEISRNLWESQAMIFLRNYDISCIRTHTHPQSIAEWQGKNRILKWQKIYQNMCHFHTLPSADSIIVVVHGRVPCREVMLTWTCAVTRDVYRHFQLTTWNQRYCFLVYDFIRYGERILHDKNMYWINL